MKHELGLFDIYYHMCVVSINTSANVTCVTKHTITLLNIHQQWHDNYAPNQTLTFKFYIPICVWWNVMFVLHFQRLVTHTCHNVTFLYVRCIPCTINILIMRIPRKHPRTCRHIWSIPSYRNINIVFPEIKISIIKIRGSGNRLISLWEILYWKNSFHFEIPTENQPDRRFTIPCDYQTMLRSDQKTLMQPYKHLRGINNVVQSYHNPHYALKT